MNNLSRFNVEEILAEFRKDGVVTLKQWLSSDELFELSCHAAPHFERAPRKGKYPGILKNLDKHDSWFHSHIHEGPHVELMSKLLDADIVPASAGCFVKRPNESESRIDPHRDLGPWKSAKQGATIWFAIDPANPNNGSVNYLRGSHLEEQLSPMDTSRIYQADLQPGDAVVHNARTIHWSKGNSSPHLRRGITYFYWVKP